LKGEISEILSRSRSHCFGKKGNFIPGKVWGVRRKVRGKEQADTTRVAMRRKTSVIKETRAGEKKSERRQEEAGRPLVGGYRKAKTCVAMKTNL